MNADLRQSPGRDSASADWRSFIGITSYSTGHGQPRRLLGNATARYVRRECKAHSSVFRYEGKETDLMTSPES